MAIVTVAAYIVIPLVTLAVVLCKFDLVQEKEFAETYKALYEGLAITNGRKVLLDPANFLLKRFCLALLVIFGPKVLIYQMMPLLYANMLTFLITYLTGSLADSYERRLQTFSGMTILLTSNCFLAFNIVSVEHNFSLGYTTVGIVALYVFICGILILRKVVIFLQASLRMWMVKRAYKKSRKQLNVNLKSTRPLRIERLHQIRRRHFAHE
mmetsp:Transcript_6439/g.8626  ORF Transcript_6439/g.8626 Transcript_6439/m.8626 type:complete len:211 (+) Transcript_6439:2053-2685(+)